MTRYIIRRLLQAIPVLIIISVILFALMMNMGDPVASMSGGRSITRSADRERLTRQLGLDKPIYVQYLYWLVGNDWTKVDLNGDGVPETPGIRKGVLRGDFGTSMTLRRPVVDVIGERLPNTLLLMLAAEIIIILGSLLIGVFSALHQYSAWDNIITTVTFIFYSMPIFFIALISMYLFGVLFKQWGLPYLPTVGMFDPKVGQTTSQVAWHMVLPVLSIALISFAAYSRYVRSTMLEVMNQDYIRTARSKGLQRRDIVYLHALKNASLPIVTVVGLDLPLLLGGAVITERIFAWPGMGRLFLDQLGRSDTPVVMGILMMIAFAVIIFQIITDIAYAWLDPRIRYGT
jgi:peptide/nickel transport system permease protein